MKTKTLVTLLVLLGVLAGAGALIVHLMSPERSEVALGTPLLGELPANQIVAMTLKGPDEEVSLVKKDNVWVVQDCFDYPADFSRMTDLVRNLKEARVGRHFESSDDILRRLSLKDPEDPQALEEEKGVMIQLSGPGETPLAGILLGKTRETGTQRFVLGGQYVMLDQDSKVYLIDKHFSSFDAKPSAWLKKDLVDVKPGQVRKLLCMNGDRKKIRYAFERPEQGKDLQPIHFPAGSKAEKSALNKVASVLSSLRLEDVVDPSTPLESIGMESPALFEYHLFSGMIYRVYPNPACKEAGSCYIRLEVDYQGPATEEEEEDKEASAEKEDVVPKKTPEEYALEAKQLNDRLSPWVYVISKWKHDAFLSDLDQLLEKPDDSQREDKG